MMLMILNAKPIVSEMCCEWDYDDDDAADDGGNANVDCDDGDDDFECAAQFV